MSDIVQQGREPRGVAIQVVYMWHELVAVGTEAPPVAGVPLESPDHPFCSFYDSPRVLEAVVTCPRVYEVCHAELAYPAQALEQRRVQKHRFPRQKLHDTPDGVVESLGIRGM